jgi:hypothetical protein
MQQFRSRRQILHKCLTSIYSPIPVWAGFLPHLHLLVHCLFLYSFRIQLKSGFLENIYWREKWKCTLNKVLGNLTWPEKKVHVREKVDFLLEWEEMSRENMISGKIILFWVGSGKSLSQPRSAKETRVCSVLFFCLHCTRLYSSVDRMESNFPWR